MKSERLQIRIAPDERASFELLARLQGMDLSGWVRAACYAAAERVGRPVRVGDGK